MARIHIFIKGFVDLDKNANTRRVYPADGTHEKDARVAPILYRGCIILLTSPVKHLQVYLNIYRMRAGKCEPGDAYLEENGIMDTKTERALREFQLDHGIYEVDFAGDETKARLYELIGDLIQIPQSTQEPSWGGDNPSVDENGNPTGGDNSISDGSQGLG